MLEVHVAGRCVGHLSDAVKPDLGPDPDAGLYLARLLHGHKGVFRFVGKRTQTAIPDSGTQLESGGFDFGKDGRVGIIPGAKHDPLFIPVKVKAQHERCFSSHNQSRFFTRLAGR